MKNKWVAIACVILIGMVFYTGPWQIYLDKKDKRTLATLLEDPTIRLELLNSDAEVNEIIAIGKGYYQIWIEGEQFVVGLRNKGSSTEYTIYENKTELRQAR
ncbi:hypothetical protein [Sutcliffiella halmapala]|uniref:hypothetical protein n=1 Tax=Sutcliffiella halmapala TaxID=79882 RepID=UPI0009950D6F|nr:hypothetical protein [Sutcliffiella halmapala]